MINFLELESPPSTNIKQDEIKLSYYEELTEEVNKGLEDNYELLALDEEFKRLEAGLEEYFTKLPIYLNAMDIVSKNILEVMDYQAGIEDNIDFNSVEKNIIYVTKTLNLKIEEVDAGLLDNDPDDTKNTNIFLKILRKIFSIIVGLIKGILRVIGKIISVFIRFIKKLLGIKDPASEMKEKLEKYKEEHSSGGGFGGFGGISTEVPSYDKDIINKTNEAMENDELPISEDKKETVNKIKDLLDKEEKKEREKLLPPPENKKLITDKKLEKRLKTLKDLYLKIKREYPIATLIANKIFEFEKEISVVQILVVLYLLDISTISSIFKTTKDEEEKSSEKDEGLTVDTVVYNFYKLLKEFDDSLYKWGDKIRPSHILRSEEDGFFEFKSIFTIDKFIEAIKPLIGGKDKKSSIVGYTRIFTTVLGAAFDEMSDTFIELLDNIKTIYPVEHRRLMVRDTIIEVLSDKLGYNLQDAFFDYVTMDHRLKKYGVKVDKYKYYRLGFLGFTKNGVNLLVHCTNIKDLDNYEKLNIDLPEKNSMLYKENKEFIERCIKLLKEELPQIAKDNTGEIVVIKIPVEYQDVEKYITEIREKEIITSAVLISIDDLSLITMLKIISKLLEKSIGDMEIYLDKTKTIFTKIDDTIKDIEKKLNTFIRNMGIFADINGDVATNNYYKGLEEGVKKEELISHMDGRLLKKEVIIAIKEGLLNSVKVVESSVAQFLNIYRYVIVYNSKEIRDLVGSKLFSLYTDELVRYYEMKDGIGGLDD